MCIHRYIYTHSHTYMIHTHMYHGSSFNIEGMHSPQLSQLSISYKNPIIVTLLLWETEETGCESSRDEG